MLKKKVFLLLYYSSWHVLDDSTIEFVWSTEWLPKSPDSNPLDYHFWNDLKQLVNKNKEDFLSHWSCCNKTENVWPLISVDNIQSATDQWKKRVQLVIEENWVLFSANSD
jgi:hypothetical protein